MKTIKSKVFGHTIKVSKNEVEELQNKVGNIYKTNVFLASNPDILTAKKAFLVLSYYMTPFNKPNRHRILTYILKKERATLMEGGNRNA